MTFARWWTSSRTRLDVTAGLVDGILNALTLAAGRMVRDGAGANLTLAGRVGAAAALTTLFVFFTAHYAELRAELVRAERQLNFASHSKLARSALGRQVLGEAALGALGASGCGLVGAALPLALATMLPGPAWLSLPLTLGLLAALGGVLAHSFHGRPAVWATVIALGGAILTAAGLELNLVG